MAKSVIKKVIARKIRTADYEQLDVNVEVEEEISWNTEEERKIRTREVSKRLMDDFIETYNDAVKAIGANRCIGVVNSKGQKTPDITKSDTIDFSF